jgi:2-phosphoxylose phosphatase
MAATMRRPGMAGLLLLFSLFVVFALFLQRPAMLSQSQDFFSAALLLLLPPSLAAAQAVNLTWFAPTQTSYNNLTAALGSEGVYGFIFNTSDTPDSQYGTYNWCNMPHVRSAEYVKPADGFQLRYVELVGSSPPQSLTRDLGAKCACVRG